MAVRQAPVDVTVRAPDLRRLLADLKEFEPKLATALRRTIRNAGKVAAEDSKRAVLSGPGSGRTGLRAGIAAGIGVRVMTGRSTQGVRIVSTGSRLPANKKPMVKAYNQASFRHPLFGDTRHWYPQQGRPYFGSVIGAHRAQFQRAVQDALDEAARTIANKRY